MSKRSATVYWTGFSIILALLVVAPLVLPEFWRRFLTEILIWGLLAMSSDILIGYTGMVSFGHSAFFGLGMYGAAAALLMVSPPNLWLAILYGLIGSAGIALFVAYFSTRLRDIYFAITTLIFSQIFYVLIFTWTEVTGGENGLTFRHPPLEIPGLFAGLAGVLYALQNRFAAPDFVYFLVSGETVIFNVMGGIGTLVGPIVGAGFFLLLREAFSRFFTEYYLIPVGVIFIAMVIFMPQGLLGFMRRWLNQ